MNTLEQWLEDKYPGDVTAELAAMQVLHKAKKVSRNHFWAKDATEAECAEAVALLEKAKKK
jgi:hypothetical protein